MLFIIISILRKLSADSGRLLAKTNREEDESMSRLAAGRVHQPNALRGERPYVPVAVSCNLVSHKIRKRYVTCDTHASVLGCSDPDPLRLS